jgi:hypothetical protein
VLSLGIAGQGDIETRGWVARESAWEVVCWAETGGLCKLKLNNVFDLVAVGNRDGCGYCRVFARALRPTTR